MVWNNCTTSVEIAYVFPARIWVAMGERISGAKVLIRLQLVLGGAKVAHRRSLCVLIRNAFQFEVKSANPATLKILLNEWSRPGSSWPERSRASKNRKNLDESIAQYHQTCRRPLTAKRRKANKTKALRQPPIHNLLHGIAASMNS